MIETRDEILTATRNEIDPLSLLRQLRATGEPIVLAINGRASLLVQDEMSYQKLVELVDRLETLDIVREGIAATERGEGRPAEEVFAEIRRKHGLPPAP